METQLARPHRIHNRLQTVMIITGMTLLAGLSGQLLLGDGAFWWMALAVVVMLLLSPRTPAAMVMRIYGARRLEHWEAPELSRILEILAARARLSRTPRLYYLPSAVMNAFTVGDHDDSAVAVTDALLRRLNLRELAGVLAHEVSHIAHHDIRVMGIADMVTRLTDLMSFLGLALVIAVLPLWLFGLAEVSLLGILLLLAAPKLAAMLQAGLSRTREFDADLGAAELTNDPEGLASALAKLEQPGHGWLRQIFHRQGGESAPSSLRSHPPTDDRIRRLLELTPERPGYHHPLALDDSDSLFSPYLVAITRRPRRHWTGFWY